MLLAGACHSRPACTFYKVCTLYQHWLDHVPLLVADATLLTNAVIMLTPLFPRHVSSYSCLEEIKMHVYTATLLLQEAVITVETDVAFSCQY